MDRSRCLYFSANAERSYWDAPYKPNSCLVFGSETEGMPPRILEKHPERCFTIPMSGPVRSLNLANAVSIVLYEALRQVGGSRQSQLQSRSHAAARRLYVASPAAEDWGLVSWTRLYCGGLGYISFIAAESSWNAEQSCGRRRRQRGRDGGAAPRRKESGPHRRHDRRGRGRAAGQGLDQWQSGPIEGFDTRVIGTNGYDEAAGAEVFVVTAGIARKPGMSRDDLVKTNAGIVRSVAEQIARVAPEVHHRRGLESARRDVLRGHEGHRLSPRARARHGRRARHRALPHVPGRGAGRLGRDIQAMVLGGHGDTMVPLVSYTTVSGIPVTQLMDRQKLDAIVDRTRNGGAEIVAFLKTGSAYYAPSAAAVQMVEAIALDKKRILPCSAWLQGEFGLKDVFCGVPCKLGRNGLEQIIEVTLTDAERDGAAASQPRRCARPRRWSTRERSCQVTRLRLLWDSSVGKKVVMAVTGLIMVAYLITHVRSQPLVFQGPTRINAYSAFLHGTGGALWAGPPDLAPRAHPPRRGGGAARSTAPVGRDRSGMPAGASRRSPPWPRARIRWGGGLILVFLIYHILHFTLGTAHPAFVEGDPYHNVATGFRNPAGGGGSTWSRWSRSACTSITASGAAGGAWA